MKKENVSKTLAVVAAATSVILVVKDVRNYLKERKLKMKESAFYEQKVKERAEIIASTYDITHEMNDTIALIDAASTAEEKEILKKDLAELVLKWEAEWKRYGEVCDRKFDPKQK